MEYGFPGRNIRGLNSLIDDCLLEHGTEGLLTDAHLAESARLKGWLKAPAAAAPRNVRQHVEARQVAVYVQQLNQRDHVSHAGAADSGRRDRTHAVTKVTNAPPLARR